MSEDGKVWMHASCYANGHKPEEEGQSCFRCSEIIKVDEEIVEMIRGGNTYLIHEACSGKRKLEFLDTKFA